MKQTERAAQSAGSRVLDFVVASAAPLILWFSFLNVYTYDPVGVPCSEIDGGGSYVLGICHDSGESGAGATAWHGFFSWSAMLLLLVAASAGVTAAVLRRHSRTGWPLFVGAGAAALGLIALAVTALDVPTYPPWLEFVRTGTLGTVTPSDDYAGTIDDGVGPGWYLILITGLLLAAAAALRLRQWSRRPAGPNPPD